MKCPACSDTDLQMADRQGVEIDYCPKCRGVWLDRGELDKIIERVAGMQTGAPASTPASPAAPPPAANWPQQPAMPPPPPPYRRDDDSDYGKYTAHGAQGHYHGHKKKKRGFLGEMFDFD